MRRPVLDFELSGHTPTAQTYGSSRTPIPKSGLAQWGVQVYGGALLYAGLIKILASVVAYSNALTMDSRRTDCESIDRLRGYEPGHSFQSNGE